MEKRSGWHGERRRHSEAAQKARRQGKEKKILIMNLATIQGIRNAERSKTRLENAGYSLVYNQQIGMDKWKAVYER